MTMPPTKERGAAAIRESLDCAYGDVDLPFTQATEDLVWLLAERDELREALGKLEHLPIQVTDEYAYRVTEIAHRALEFRP